MGAIMGGRGRLRHRPPGRGRSPRWGAMGQILFHDCNLLDAAAGETRSGHHGAFFANRLAP